VPDARSAERWAQYGIWIFAFCYFASYVPYSLLVKTASKGLLPGMGGEGVKDFAVLPLSVAASTVSMLLFITAMKWWGYASRWKIGGHTLPRPTFWTFLSGICTSLIIGTTTLAYSFQGVSIVFAMVLMRGGVLILAPVVDAISRRHVRWFSWMGLFLALGALLVSLRDTDSYEISVLCAIDILVYLASYFVRLRFMSKLAKSDHPEANKRYFVEEQMVAAPLLFLSLGILALIGEGDVLSTIRSGFTDYWGTSTLFFILLIGIFSQGTGIFGSLIFLDPRENTYTVPVNRSSSVIAGVLASFLLMLFPDQKPPRESELAGAGIIVLAILFLTIPPGIEKRRRRALAGAPASGG
jgi:hypothetical protein